MRFAVDLGQTAKSVNRHGRARPGHPRLSCFDSASEDADVRHKAGHDDKTHSQMQHDARSVAMLMWASTKNSAPAKLRSN
jgi:hypothetical protein